MRDRCKLSFPRPPRSRVLARLTSLTQIGELARRLTSTNRRDSYGTTTSVDIIISSNVGVVDQNFEGRYCFLSCQFLLSYLKTLSFVSDGVTGRYLLPALI